MFPLDFPLRKLYILITRKRLYTRVFTVGRADGVNMMSGRLLFKIFLFFMCFMAIVSFVLFVAIDTVSKIWKLPPNYVR